MKSLINNSVKWQYHILAPAKLSDVSFAPFLLQAGCQELSWSGGADWGLRRPVGLQEQKVLTGVGGEAAPPSAQCSAAALHKLLQIFCDVARCYEKWRASCDSAGMKTLQTKKEWSVWQQTIISARAHRLEYGKKYLYETLLSYILNFSTNTDLKWTGPIGGRPTVDVRPLGAVYLGGSGNRCASCSDWRLDEKCAHSCDEWGRSDNDRERAWLFKYTKMCWIKEINLQCYWIYLSCLLCTFSMNSY